MQCHFSLTNLLNNYAKVTVKIKAALFIVNHSVYHFLSVFHSYYVCILYRFQCSQIIVENRDSLYPTCT